MKDEILIMKDNQDLNAASNIINQVRARVELGALSSAVRGNKASMLEALLTERRLELAFEGQRWYDLRRLDKVEEVMNSVYAKDSGRRTQVYPFNEYSYRMPLPVRKMDQNLNLKQNLGY